MKLLHLSLLLLALLTWTGCEDEDAPTLTTLNYDGANATAPSLPAGINKFAVYFPPERTIPYSGRDLERVTFYVSAIPTATRVAVHKEGPDNLTPGDVIERRDISARVTTTGWYEHRLTNPLTLSDEGIWLVVEVEVATDGSRAIGCDAGRNYNPNGDLIQYANATQYGSFQQITGNETVNWNIRGVLAAE